MPNPRMAAMQASTATASSSSHPRLICKRLACSRTCFRPTWETRRYQRIFRTSIMRSSRVCSSRAATAFLRGPRVRPRGSSPFARTMASFYVQRLTPLMHDVRTKGLPFEGNVQLLFDRPIITWAHRNRPVFGTSTLRHRSWVHHAGLQKSRGQSRWPRVDHRRVRSEGIEARM